MNHRTKLPIIVMSRRMTGEPATETNPKVTFELEAETGEVFVITFHSRDS